MFSLSGSRGAFCELRHSDRRMLDFYTKLGSFKPVKVAGLSQDILAMATSLWTKLLTDILLRFELLRSNCWVNNHQVKFVKQTLVWLNVECKMNDFCSHENCKKYSDYVLEKIDLTENNTNLNIIWCVYNVFILKQQKLWLVNTSYQVKLSLFF